MLLRIQKKIIGQVIGRGDIAEGGRVMRVATARPGAVAGCKTVDTAGRAG
ncbi:MAG: hypothetical protein NNA23_12970 [Nitrospira sp.]|nr:hypothetical protein [Nitrospira sp.]